MFRHGDKISLEIEGTYVEGELVYCKVHGGAYIAHNNDYFSGASPSKMPDGYRYSWCLNIDSHTMSNMVQGDGYCDWRNLYMVSKKPSYYGTTIKFRMT
jgi:hypothetical protein